MSSDRQLIWVIDDDSDVCSHLRMVLRRAELDVELRPFTSAAAARRALDDRTVDPRVVLIDQFLPDALGATVVGSVRDALPDAAVMLISAAPEEVDRGGVDIEVLPKPVSIDALRRHLIA